MPFRVEIDKKAIQKLQKTLKRLSGVGAVDIKTANAIGKSVVKTMKRGISKGRSPISKKGKFPAYRGGYRDRIRKGQIRGKKLTPVNLKLSGDFLKALGYRVVLRKQNAVAQIRITGQSERKKELGHRKGANRQRKRPIIPVARKRERFNKTISDKIRKILQDLIIRIIK